MCIIWIMQHVVFMIVRYIWFCTFRMVSFSNKNSFTYLSPVWIPLFSHLIVVARTQYNGEWEWWQWTFCLVSNLRWSVSLLPVSLMIGFLFVCFYQMPFIRLRKILSAPFLFVKNFKKYLFMYFRMRERVGEGAEGGRESTRRVPAEHGAGCRAPTQDLSQNQESAAQMTEPPWCPLLRAYIMNKCWTLSNTVLPFILLTWYTTLIDFQILSQPHILGVNLTRSCCTILVICCCFFPFFCITGIAIGQTLLTVSRITVELQGSLISCLRYILNQSSWKILGTRKVCSLLWLLSLPSNLNVFVLWLCPFLPTLRENSSACCGSGRAF